MDQFEARLKSLPLVAPSESFGRPQMLAALLETDRADSARRQKISRLTWKSSAAALVGIAAAALVAYILLSASTGNSVALAQVAAKVAGAGTLSFVQTTEPLDGKTPKITLRVTSLGTDKCRTEIQTSKPEEEEILISDYAAGKEITLWPAKKKALITTIKGQPAPGDFVQTREEFRNYLKWPFRSLGHKLIDGVECTGFEVDQGSQKTQIWADAKTGDPVRSESNNFPMPPPWGICKVVVSDFKIDEKVDPALFSIEPPEGYTVEQNPWVNDLSKTPAQLVTSILRTYAENMDGQFPARLTDMGQSIFADLKKKGWDEQQFAKKFDLVGNVLLLNRFFHTGKQGADYQYFPGGKLSEKDRIVFWYKDKNSGEYNAVYGDLRVEKVDKEKLPPAAESPNTGEK